MRLPKIEKVESDIAETKAKIAEYQARLRSLERLKIDVENDMVIRAMRSESISDAELNALMEPFRKKEAITEPAEVRLSAKEITRQEETQDANTEKD
jgi:hypothetical protein